MSAYPILVERFKSDQSLRIICNAGCGWEATITPDGIRNEENYDCGACHGPAVYKYMEADRCPNCRQLGFFADVLGGCCSRACQLQIEYAASLGRA